MKKILSGIAVLVVLFAFVSCGEKKEEPKGKLYDQKLFSIVVPEGCTATEDQQMGTVISKGNEALMAMSAQADNKETMQSIVDQIKKEPKIKDVKFEDVKMGENTLKKISFKAENGNPGVMMVCIKGTTLVAMQFKSFESAEEKAIVESLKIK